MKLRVAIYLLLLVVAGSLVTCTDHSVPGVTPGSSPARLRVKSLTSELPNNVAKVSSFTYDGQGRLSSILTYQTPDSTVAELVYNVYLYDSQNRLTRLQRTRIPFPRPQNNQSVDGTSYVYSYNALGQVSAINAPNMLAWTYSYNAANQLARAVSRFSLPQFTIEGDIQFAFTGKNLTQTTGGTIIRYQGMPPGTSDRFPGVGPATYTHDDKINPFYGIPVIPPFTGGFGTVLSGPTSPGALFGGTDNVLNLSQNNVLSETPPSGQGYPLVTYQYQYNATNLPTVRIKTTGLPNPTGSVTIETLRFEYESY
ncbi:hypothetical protein [Spirosoma validum]|uniref:YD repeat-containing protein n=1 Tax=Spirosoma validum TaxID=2771355 RepID=A0A927GDW2_9BACT|nr:hypothetical protein [Spirosoma validum]MBD2754207.1 hypothetical protein [Spirosoma validum]